MAIYYYNIYDNKADYQSSDKADAELIVLILMGIHTMKNSNSILKCLKDKGQHHCSPHSCIANLNSYYLLGCMKQPGLH